MTKDQPKQPFKLDLINNGIDFIRSGIETFFKDDKTTPTDHKYAVIHMFAGTLLILKARLAKEHSSLIYANVGEARKQNAVTVNYKDLMARLEACTDSPPSPTDRKTLDDAKDMRNRIEHYECDFNLEDTQVLVGDLAEFLLRFLRDQLATDLEQKLAKPVWERLCNVKKVAAEIHREREGRWKQLAQHLMSLDIKNMSPAEFEQEVAKVKMAKPPLFQCVECSLATRRNPHPPHTVARLNNVGICTNSACRTLYGPATCGMCGDPLPPSRAKSGDCLGCWAELHLSPEEIYDDGEGEEDT